MRGESLQRIAIALKFVTVKKAVYDGNIDATGTMLQTELFNNEHARVRKVICKYLP